MNQKLALPEVTLVGLTSVKIYETVRAMQYSMRGIRFGDAVLLTDRKPLYLPRGIRWEPVDRMCTVDDYSRACLYELHRHIRTGHALIVHYDGYVVNPDQWDDAFLQYDYIGAPWPEKPHFMDPHTGEYRRVGNGVSLRSLRLMRWTAEHGAELPPDETGKLMNGDGFLCVQARKEMAREGFRWAPFSMALRFGREKTLAENQDIEPFLFHKWTAQNQYPEFMGPATLMEKLRRHLGSRQNGRRQSG